MTLCRAMAACMPRQIQLSTSFHEGDGAGGDYDSWNEARDSRETLQITLAVHA